MGPAPPNDHPALPHEDPMPNKLTEHPIHLGLGASATAQPPFTGMTWYADYTARTSSDGAEGRLVSMHTFHDPWDAWEMHPHGAEVVICTEGQITLIQKLDSEESRITLGPGDYAINPPGVWHTADVDAAATAIFITAGIGTEHRSR